MKIELYEKKLLRLTEIEHQLLRNDKHQNNEELSIKDDSNVEVDKVYFRIDAVVREDK